jgi:NAD(P)H dehydrogenase (quinone)
LNANSKCRASGADGDGPVFSEEQWRLDAWVSTYTAIRDGTCEHVSKDIEHLTGHPACTFEEAITQL